jgi:hypothetical protein
MPQYGPGPIPENSKTLMPFNGPILICYWKTLNLTNKFGKRDNEEIKATNIARAVKIPNNCVGKKFDKDKIEKPVAMVAAV